MLKHVFEFTYFLNKDKPGEILTSQYIVAPLDNNWSKAKEVFDSFVQEMKYKNVVLYKVIDLGTAYVEQD